MNATWSPPRTITYLTANWCAPCKTLLPKVRDLADELGVRLDVIDVDRDPWKVPSGVMGVPTIFVRTNGEVTSQLSPDTATIPALRKALS